MPSNPPVIERLGIAVKAVVYDNSQAVLASSPAGRQDMFYISYYASSGSELLGLEPLSGEAVRIPLGSRGGYGLAVGCDNAFYVGGVLPGNFQRVDGAGGGVANLGGEETGSTYIWQCAASVDGRKIYGAAYPTCSVLEYDTQTRTIRRFGPLRGDCQYVRSVCVDPRGMVWAGVGTHADLFVIDPRSGQWHSVLPEEMKANSMVTRLMPSGGYVWATVCFGGEHLIYDVRTEKVVQSLRSPSPLSAYHPVSGALPGEFYLFLSPEKDLCHYKVGDDRPMKLAENLGACFLVKDHRWVYAMDDQDLVVYDLQARQTVFRRTMGEAREGMAVYTMASGSDGNVYGSTYINQHIFRVDSATGGVSDLGKVIRWGGQVDSMTGGPDGRIYMGSYVNAVVSVYDPRKPWKPGPAGDCNPREIGPVGKGQYRTVSIVLGCDRKIYMGSVPSYESAKTGAFSRIDPAANAADVWTDLVPQGAVKSLAADDRYVYGAGGGKFLVWDCAAGEVKLTIDEPAGVLRTKPGDGAGAFAPQYNTPASVLAVTAEGEVLLAFKDRVQVFSPRDMRIVREFANPLGGFSHLCRHPDGCVYGINRGHIGRIRPGQAVVEQVFDGGGKHLAVDGQGRLYFARDAEIFRLTL